MKARANTRVSILRGTSTDGFGDTVDGLTAVTTGVNASLIEQSQTVRRRDEREPRTIRSTRCRLPAGTDIRRGDRIKDESTGVIYVFDEQVDPGNPVRRTDIRLDLRRVT